MKGCKEPDSLCRFSSSDDPNRKLKYTLEMVKSGTTWVGVNTSLPNKIVHEAVENKIISEWSLFNRIQREVYVSDKSRIDFAMWSDQKSGKNTDRLEFKKINLKKIEIKISFCRSKKCESCRK